ncbi:MAG: hypothetical protein MJ125_01300 [Clostridia bacterium]|nr:hypothetical protein [Clostridia bacterium]
MKRIVILTMILLASVCFTACGNAEKSSADTAAGKNETELAEIQPEVTEEKTTTEKAPSTEIDIDPVEDKTETSSVTETEAAVPKISVPYSTTTKPAGTTSIVHDPKKPTAPRTYTGTICNDAFMIKEISGTKLVLTRYSLTAGELKEGLYTCDYGNVDGSNKMEFHVGDVVTIRYINDNLDMNVYPYQMKIEEIYIAEWNGAKQ